MLDIGWAELAVLAVVALIVIGPRDLPGALHTLGRWAARARAVVREFQSGIDEIARESEMRDLRNRIGLPENLDVKRQIERFVDEEIEDETPPHRKVEARSADEAAATLPSPDDGDATAETRSTPGTKPE
jgi:sec-independent protein translocase protein TatB